MTDYSELKANLRNPNNLWRAADAVEAADAIEALIAERDSLLAGHRILNIDGARLQARAEAADAEKTKWREAWQRSLVEFDKKCREANRNHASAEAAERLAEARAAQLDSTLADRAQIIRERDAARDEAARLRDDIDAGARDYCALMERHDMLVNEVARLRKALVDTERYIDKGHVEMARNIARAALAQIAQEGGEG